MEMARKMEMAREMERGEGRWRLREGETEIAERNGIERLRSF